MALPLHFDGESTRGVEPFLPMTVKSLSALRIGLSGTACRLAASAISPKLARLPEAWLSTPLETFTSVEGTFHASAAAATSIPRAAAPALRYCKYELAMAV